MRCDFYLLAQTVDKRLFICRLIKKIYEKSHQLYIYCPDEIEANLLNDQLWSFEQQSFIPHALLGEYTTHRPPIEIGYNTVHHENKIQILQRELYLNLSEELLLFDQPFERCLEVINNLEDIKNKTKKYDFYQQQHYEIIEHVINK